jgi:hypothetical protein
MFFSLYSGYLSVFFFSKKVDISSVFFFSKKWIFHPFFSFLKKWIFHPCLYRIKVSLHILISKRNMRVVEIKDMVDGTEYLIQRNGEDGLSSTLPMGALGHPKGEGEPDVLLSRCSGKSLRDLSRLQSGEKTLRGKGIFDSKITRDANYVSYDSHDSAGFRKFRKFPSELNIGVVIFNSSNHVFFIPVFPRLTDESVLRQVINQGTKSALGSHIGSHENNQ